MSTYVQDLLERIVATFFQGAIAAGTVAWLASGLDVSSALADLSGLEKIGYAALSGGLAAVLSLLKGLLAKKVGSPDSASLVAVEPARPPGTTTVYVGGGGNTYSITGGAATAPVEPPEPRAPNDDDDEPGYLVYTGMSDEEAENLPGAEPGSDPGVQHPPH